LKHPHKRWFPFAVCGLALLAACGSDKVTPPEETPQLQLPFWEPRSFCLPSTATSDTLFITNFDDEPFIWQPTHAPSGSSTNLNQTFAIDSATTVAILWTWNPPGSGTVTDSLVVLTANPDVPRIVIPFRRVAAGYVDIEPPAAPILAVPADGDTFHVGNEIQVLWSRVSDCSGISRYDFQLALDPQFQQIVPLDPVGVNTGAEITVEPDDEGHPAYWRVRARDKAGLNGPWSEVRSWTVEPLGTSPQ
jgi:hypothetical protein